jgi:multiple antibiotic resistance protein
MTMSAVLKAFISLFIIMDPIGNIPVFLAVTGPLNRDQQKKAFTLSAVIAFFILLFFGVCGQFVLEEIFHIKIADLLIAGGILLFLVAVRNLLCNPLLTVSDTQKIIDPKEIACVPLACPLLAGPGAMITMLTIWHSPEAGSWVALTALSIVLIWFWFQMRIVYTINRFFGKLIITAFSKVMLIFVGAIGVKMTIQGIQYYFPVN